MDTKIMKNVKNTFLKWILGTLLLFTGVQTAYSMQCDGTIYIKLPATWTAAVINMDGSAIPFPKTMENGWYVFDAAKLGQSYSKEFIIMQTNNGWNDGGITTNHYAVPGGAGGWDQADKFSCNDIIGTGALYISEDPTTPGKTAYSGNPPDAKYLFMMIPPDFEEWMSTTPMISMDGGVTGKPMKADPDKCGWYYYVWFGEEISDDVVFYRDDDPEKEDMIGAKGNWETADKATPIPLNTFFESYGTDTLYFVPDEDQFLLPTDNGWYTAYPEGVKGTCEYTLAAVIYDTDASLHGAFTCNPDWSSGQTPTQAAQNACASPSAPFQVAAANGVIPCIGVTQGMVSDVLDHTKGSPNYKKPTLTAIGRQCFGSQADAAFAAMFNSTPGVNETYCVDMPFSKSADNKWEFDSDTYQSNGATVPGGFYPAEETPPADRFMSAPLPAAETKRKAEGPVFMCQGLRDLDPKEGVPYSDLLCKGPGWTKGADCNGMYAGGSEFAEEFNGVSFTGDGWGWGCPNEAPLGWQFYTEGTEKPTEKVAAKGQIPKGTSRWTSGKADGTPLTGAGRNQHFCFESHAKFTYKPGLRFSFRGDDDIWVYIDNKLAVDLGGTHLAAPGYVDLDNFVGASGALANNLQYDLDIFFCDRRTTMSNVRIKTNMYIKQSVSLEFIQSRDPVNPEIKTYEMCYTKTGDGSCSAAMSGNDEAEKCCGDEIFTKCQVPLQYYLVPGSVFAEDKKGDPLPTGGVYKGGIDLTSASKPKIDPKKVQLPAGKWTLFAYADGQARKIQTFRTQGAVDVMFKTPKDVLDSNGDPIKGLSYQFINEELAGQLVPVYVTALINDETTGDLSVSPTDAMGVTYTLNVTSGLQLYTKQPDGTLNPTPIKPNEPRNIGATGVDTLYATVPFIAMSSNEQAYSINVSGSSTTPATIKFYVPYLSFCDSSYSKNIGGETPNAAGEFEEYWLGIYNDMYLVAMTPSGALCEKCDFDIMLGSETSAKIEANPAASLKIEGGKGMIQVRALQEYRWDKDPAIHNPAAIYVISVDNPAVKATYTPIYFRAPPVPIPVLTDVFDAHGALLSGEPNLPAEYYSMTQEYQDGIGDSAAVYYNRPIAKDSLPTFLCFLWDESSAEKLNPYELGISNKSEDKEMLCNDWADASKIQCVGDSYMDEEGVERCVARIEVGGLKLSASPKTGGNGTEKVISWARFKDKGKEMTQGFPGVLTDRMAPIIVAARVSKASETQDRMVIELSEPIASQKNLASSFTFYLNSATELDESARLKDDISAVAVSDKTDKITAMYLSDDASITPHVGDYIRLSGDIDNVFWLDTANINVPGSDTIRVVDTEYNWNAPTAYKSSVRMPSPWVQITGEAKVTVKENAFAHTGNAPAGENVPMVQVFAVPTTKNMDFVKDELSSAPGHFVMSDMNAVINSEERYSDYFKEHRDELDQIYFFYNVEYYTNLGGYVGSQSGKINCKDPVFFEGGDCFKTGRNFYIAWNMRSDEGREVATGAYIVKLQSYVKLGKFGKKNSLDRTSVWGVRRAAAPYKK